jgi:hypothetical protein
MKSTVSRRQRKVVRLCAIIAWFTITMMFFAGVGVTHLQGNLHMSALDSGALVMLFLLIVRFLNVGVDDIFRI